MDINLQILFFVTPDYIQECLQQPDFLAHNPPKEKLGMEKYKHYSLINVLAGFKKFKDVTAHLKICQFLLLNLEAEFVTDFTKSYIQEHVVVLLLLVILLPDAEHFTRSLRDFLPREEHMNLVTEYDKTSYHEHMNNLHQFLALVHEQIHYGLERRDVHIIEAIVTLYMHIQNIIIEETRARLAARSLEIGFVQPYISTLWRKRIELFSYLPNAREVFNLLNFSFPVKFFIVEKGRREKNAIQWEEWLELCSYLPDTWPSQADESLNTFKRLLYEINVFPTEKMKRVIPSTYEHPVFPVPPKNILLLQMIVLQMKNWQILWFRSNWPRDADLIKRLHFIKTIENFEPSAKDMLRLGFGNCGF